MEKKKKDLKKGEKAESGKGIVREYFESLVVAIILALIIKTFILQTFQIPTGSMEDGLLVGDHLIVNKMIYGEEIPVLGSLFGLRDIDRGDIVIFKYPPDPRTDYIKRVIGLPGEHIRIHQHQVYIDGTPIEELGLDEDRYTLQWKNADRERAIAIDADPTYDPATDPDAERVFEITVPQDHYFMLGDHRSVSLDSRYWGTVPRENIMGKAVVIYWSFNGNREEYRKTGFFDQFARTIGGILTFPVNTRWDRLLRLIG